MQNKYINNDIKIVLSYKNNVQSCFKTEVVGRLPNLKAQNSNVSKRPYINILRVYSIKN